MRFVETNTWRVKACMYTSMLFDWWSCFADHGYWLSNH